MPGLHRHDRRGAPITWADETITPIARVVHVAWPGGRLEWHRPVGVEVAREGRTEQIPIRDATRRLLAGLVLSELALGALAWWGQRYFLHQSHRRRSR